MDNAVPTPEQQLLAMIFGALQGKALGLMAELGLADHLANGAMSSAALAEISGTEPVAMQRYLCLLEQLGLVSQADEDHYASTELGTLLRPSAAGSLHNYARLTNSDVVLEMVAHMRRALVSGESAFAEVYGTGFYEALQKRPDEAAIFDGAMQEISAQDIPDILAAYDFSACRTVVDVGGGQGFLLSALLQRFPRLQATLLELPDVAARARAELGGFIDADRCTVIDTDFLAAVAATGDVFILKRVLSHCSDSDAIKLLSNIRTGIEPGGRLLIIDPDTGSLYGASFNLLMLVVVGGQGVRSDRELDDLFARTGFKFVRKIPLATELCIVEAIAS